MARFARIKVAELSPFFCESRIGAIKIANRRFEAIRANRSNVMRIIKVANRFTQIAPIRVADRRTIYVPGTSRNLDAGTFLTQTFKWGCHRQSLCAPRLILLFRTGNCRDAPRFESEIREDSAPHWGGNTATLKIGQNTSTLKIGQIHQKN